MISGRKIDKFKEFGLTPISAKIVKAPLIKECAVHLECKVTHIFNIGSHDVFIGEILCVQADETVLKGKKLDYEKIKPLGYLSPNYAGLGKKLGTYGFSKEKMK